MLGRMAEYLARVQLTIWAERANPNKKLESSQSIFNIFNMTFYGKWFWMVRGGYWSLKSLSFIQFDLWNLNLKISLLAWDWCAISSEMRNRKKTNSNIVTRCQKYLSRKVSVWHFWKKNRPFSVMSEKSNTFAFELSWASQSKLTNSPLTTSSFHFKKFDAFELFGAEKKPSSIWDFENCIWVWE